MPVPVRQACSPRRGGRLLLLTASVTCCSVFPDQATLPTTGGAGASSQGGDGPANTEAGATGASHDAAGASASGGGAPGAMAGAAGDANPGAAGAGAGAAQGGEGGQPGRCPNTDAVRLPVALDTWIDATEPRSSFASSPSLLVEGAPRERRALLQLAVPAVVEGRDLLRASLSLHLEDNADAEGAARLLGLHRLTQLVGANTTWRNHSNKKWNVEGGDFGPELARTTLADAEAGSVLMLDVTKLVRDLQAAQPTTLSLIVLEVGEAPPAPAELAFTSLEGDTSRSPALLLEYCAP